MSKLNLSRLNLNNCLFDYLRKASELTIKTKEYLVIVSLEEGEIVTKVFHSGTLKKVCYHGKNSTKELILTFRELGVCFYALVQSLFKNLLSMKRSKLVLEFKDNVINVPSSSKAP